MAVVAHPDDESLGMGGTMARYAGEEGVSTLLVTATRGERGRNVASRASVPDELGALREAELVQASKVLGISEVRFLGYPDGALDQVNACEAAGAIALHIRRFRPHVILTFGPDGAYGHPDHIAICQFTTAAIVRAATSHDRLDAHSVYAPHQVSKLYYMAWTKRKWDAYQAALKKLTANVDGVERQAAPWPDWAVTTMIDTAGHWSTVWRAVSCHQTQMSIYSNLQNLSEEHHRALWGSQEFYRVFSVVSGGRRLETDLFEGLRESVSVKGGFHGTAKRSAASAETIGSS
jgi:LmbE family N-acetylglucosaminyl deacetylase